MKLSKREVFELYNERRNQAQIEAQETKQQLEQDVVVVKQYNSQGLLVQLLRNEFIVEGSPADKLLNFFGVKSGHPSRAIENHTSPMIPFMGRLGANWGESRWTKLLSRAIAFVHPSGMGGVLFDIVKPILISSGITLFEKMLRRGVSRLFRRKKRVR